MSYESNLSRMFFKKNEHCTLLDITNFFKIPCPKGYESNIIKDIKSLENAGPSDISFFFGTRGLEPLLSTNAFACLVPDNFKLPSDKLSNEYKNINLPVLLNVSDIKESYIKLINLFYTLPQKKTNFIEKSAQISKRSIISDGVYIGHNVIISDEVKVGSGCVIESGTIIYEKCIIGNNSHISANSVIQCAILGENVYIGPGVKIGQIGFGFTKCDNARIDIPHIGSVFIGNNVRIGANTTIDRGSINDTIIEDECCIDNLVQIAHNVQIKSGSVIAAQSGIAGSSIIGSSCILGGQVGISGHLRISDGTTIAAKSGVMKDTDCRALAGIPAVPITDWHRQTIFLKQSIKKR